MERIEPEKDRVLVFAPAFLPLLEMVPTENWSNRRINRYLGLFIVLTFGIGAIGMWNRQYDLSGFLFLISVGTFFIQDFMQTRSIRRRSRFPLSQACPEAEEILSRLEIKLGKVSSQKVLAFNESILLQAISRERFKNVTIVKAQVFGSLDADEFEFLAVRDIYYSELQTHYHGFPSKFHFVNFILFIVVFTLIIAADLVLPYGSLILRFTSVLPAFLVFWSAFSQSKRTIFSSLQLKESDLKALEFTKNFGAAESALRKRSSDFKCLNGGPLAYPNPDLEERVSRLRTKINQ